ncbi:hypothetical protein [Lacrimispora sphenoides]|nr:hypothetical protein [Lacrimispora sphenoides]
MGRYQATKQSAISIGNERYNFMQALNLEAKIEKVKSEIPILGRA